MELKDAIFVRKSIRTYTKQPMEPDILDQLSGFVTGLNPPFENIQWSHEVLPHDDMRRFVGDKRKLEAPYYLVLRSEKTRGCLQNTGYLGEMAVLFLTAKGIATCWQGGLECENDLPKKLPYIAAVAFGYSAEPFRASLAEFKRKRLNKICSVDLSGGEAGVIGAARLAPSGMGLQPCRFRVEAGRIEVFRKKHIIKFPAISYMQCVDAGVAMAHIEVAARAEGYDVIAEFPPREPHWPGNIYQATFIIKRIEKNEA